MVSTLLLVTVESLFYAGKNLTWKDKFTKEIGSLNARFEQNKMSKKIEEETGKLNKKTEKETGKLSEKN